MTPIRPYRSVWSDPKTQTRYRESLLNADPTICGSFQCTVSHDSLSRSYSNMVMSIQSQSGAYNWNKTAIPFFVQVASDPKANAKFTIGITGDQSWLESRFWCGINYRSVTYSFQNNFEDWEIIISPSKLH